jgi:signal transduction histidine kinase
MSRLVDTQQPVADGLQPALTAMGAVPSAGVAASRGRAVISWGRRPGSLASRLVVMGALGAAATAAAFWIGATSPVLDQPVLTASVWALCISAYLGVGLYTWWRRRDSRLGPLITGIAFVYAGMALTGSANATLHTFGMVAWSFAVIYSTCVYLCFPSGVLASSGERRLIVAFGSATAVLWLLILPLAPHPPGGGPLVSCGSSCPANGFQVIHGGAGIGAALHTAFIVVFTIAPTIVAVLLIQHARSASHLQRRTIMPLAVAAVASTAAFVISLLVLTAHPASGESLRIVSGVLRLLVPLALLVGQFRGDMFAARSLGRIAIDANGQRLTPAAVQTILSEALGDPALQLALWSEEHGCYIDVHGGEVRLPDGPRPSGVTRFDQHGAPSAALIHDATLDTDSELVHGLAATSLMLLENVRLVEEVRASRARIVATAQRERLRLERNLHDGAQQRLMAIQVRLRLAQGRADGGELAEELAAIQHDAAAAVEDLRALAHGIYPSALRDLGLSAALQSLAISGPIPIEVRDRGIGRCPGAVEQAIYFCALEAMHNASKHAGAGAHVTIELGRSEREVDFLVADDGIGMDMRTAGGGVGLISMRDRIGAVGGALTIRSSPGGGTTVRGSVPDDGVLEQLQTAAS